MVRLPINLQNPQQRIVKTAANVLEEGGLVIYPTDTVYGLGCDLFNKKAIERIYWIKGVKKRRRLSFICPDLKDIARYAQVPTPAYKLMRHLTPGPYTFILEATREVPKILLEKRKTVGIRVPDSALCHHLLEEFGRPVISTSACPPDLEYLNDPEEIAGKFEYTVDLFLDAGWGGSELSTVVDLTGAEPVILRRGKAFDPALF